MKKTLLSLFASGIVLMACGQNQTPPKAVEAAFAKQFTTVKHVKWEQEDDEWEAEFKQNGNEITACYDNTGKWLETETEVKKSDVPAEIFKVVNLKFEGWDIEEVERVEKPDFKGYEITLEKDETETEVLVSDAGELTVKKVEVEDEEENDNEDNNN